MEPVNCGYRLSLERRNSNFSGVPTAVFNFSVKWQHLLVFVDQVGVPINLQDTTLSELSQSLEIPLCILPWHFLCEMHMKRVLDALDIRSSFRADLIRHIVLTALRGSNHGHRQFNMNINLNLATIEEVKMEDGEEVSTGGYKLDPDQVAQGVSRSTIEKLEWRSYSIQDGNGCCCICLEELNGASKVMEIRCSHLFIATASSSGWRGTIRVRYVVPK